jgi:hypothetical protein
MVSAVPAFFWVQGFPGGMTGQLAAGRVTGLGGPATVQSYTKPDQYDLMSGLSGVRGSQTWLNSKSCCAASVSC